MLVFPVLVFPVLVFPVFVFPVFVFPVFVFPVLVEFEGASHTARSGLRTFAFEFMSATLGALKLGIDSPPASMLTVPVGDT